MVLRAACLLIIFASASSLHHAPMPMLRQNAQQPRMELRGGGGHAARALIQELKVPSKVAEWTVNDVVEWIKASGLGDIALDIRRNQIDGPILLDLNENRIARIGLDSLAKQIKFHDAVTQLQSEEKMPGRRQIQVPGVLGSLYRFLTFRFLMLSEGKSGAEVKHELITANTNFAVVSTLLLGVTMSWMFGATNNCFCDKGTRNNCFCSSGYDLEGVGLWAFFASSTLASVIYLTCTVTAVIQILAVNECSDQHEVLVFVDKLGKDEVLCGPLLISGLFFTVTAVAVFMTFNETLGLVHSNKNKWAYGTVAGSIAILAYIIPKWATTARTLYASKLFAAWHPEKDTYTSGVASP